MRAASVDPDGKKLFSFTQAPLSAERFPVRSSHHAIADVTRALVSKPSSGGGTFGAEYRSPQKRRSSRVLQEARRFAESSSAAAPARKGPSEHGLRSASCAGAGGREKTLTT